MIELFAEMVSTQEITRKGMGRKKWDKVRKVRKNKKFKGVEIRLGIKSDRPSPLLPTHLNFLEASNLFWKRKRKTLLILVNLKTCPP